MVDLLSDQGRTRITVRTARPRDEAGRAIGSHLTDDGPGLPAETVIRCLAPKEDTVSVVDILMVAAGPVRVGSYAGGPFW